MIRVLLVDDDERYLRTLRAFLGMHEGFTVEGCGTSGREAVSMNEVIRPDIIVMDAFMDDIDGVTATELIVRRHPDACILILSAGDDIELRWSALKAGAMAFLNKGQAVALLVPEMKRLVESRANQSQD